MKVCLILLALCCALTVRAEIDLPDAENINQPAPQKRPAVEAVPVQKAEPKPAASTPAVPPPPPKVIKDGLIRFRNGDTLHGSLGVITESGQLDWRYHDAPDPLHFSIQNVMLISLAGVAQPAAGNTLVALTNGDLLRGDIVALDAETLTLDTWYAGRLKIKRVMVRCLAPNRITGNVIVDGLTSLDGWTVITGAESWQLRGGVLTATQIGAIGRDVGLPNRASVEFDLAWQQIPSVQVGLYVKRPDEMKDGGGGSNASGYWLSLSANLAQLQRIRKTESTQLGGVEVGKFLHSGKVHLGIYVDKSARTFTLVLDGHLVKTWTDAEEFAGEGTSLILSTQIGGTQAIHIGNLMVRQWVGDLATVPTVVDKLDLLALANGDRVSGQVKSIENGAVNVSSAVTPLSIPLERVNEIYLATQSAERARRLASDVLAFFHDGGQVTVGLDSLDDKHLTGHSENFGKASFDRNAFQELQFHIYDDDRIDSLDLDPSNDPSFQIFNSNRIMLNQ